MTTAPEPHQIDNWRDAEENAARWMRHWGFNDARAKPGGSDGGIDVRSARAVAQVKFQGAPVGRPALQNLAGANMARMRQMFFFTGSNYAAPAIEYADQMDIALFRYDPWGRMEPMNDVARRTVSADSTEETNRATVREDAGFTRHFKRHWAAWLAAVFALAPIGSLGDPDVYTGPLWLDLLKGVGIFLGLWLLAGLTLRFYVEQRRGKS